ncbi:hypothetical protein FB446DRAFT_786531 [Lentinula raphanica]|nr:hypothetical protein FB446DRAFT_786531 [Lentinula raphanica]
MSIGELNTSDINATSSAPLQGETQDDTHNSTLQDPSSHPHRSSSPANNAPHSEASEDSNAQKNGYVSRKPTRKDTGHVLGLKKQGYMPQQDITDDYEQRFPEDPIFKETGPNARVWRTYLVESAAFDENMIGEARDGLDAMLVFAGLFSAVVTSFLVQTSQNLQLNSADVTASLLSELVAVQRAAAIGGNISAVPPSPLFLGSDFHPGAVDVWINGLWLVSLALALAIALAVVLAQQWLHHYVAMTSGTPKERSHICQFRFTGLQKWQVLTIIGLLPVIMHVSLALFFFGLIIFLVPLHLELALIIGSITFVVYGLYIISNVLPVLIPQCPYQTPLTEFLIRFGGFAHSMTLKIQAHWLLFHAMILVQEQKDQALREARLITSSKRIATSRLLETEAVRDGTDILSVTALHWLIKASSNQSIGEVVIQAIGGLPIRVKKEVEHVFDDSKMEVYWFLQNLAL